MLPSVPRLSSSRRRRSLRLGRGCRFLLAFHLGEALLQGGHQIHHRSQLLRFFYCGHFSTLELGLNQLLQVFLEVVFILLRIPFIRQRLDQLVRHFNFSLFQLHIGRTKSFHLADFFLVIHRVQHQSAFVRPQEYRGLTVVHRDLGNSHVFAFFQGLRQQCIGTPSRLFRHHVIGRLEIDRLHFARLHEFQNLHRLGGLRLDFFDLLRLNDDVLVLAKLVALYNLATVHHDVL